MNDANVLVMTPSGVKCQPGKGVDANDEATRGRN
jgi:hypothetical protein